MDFHAISSSVKLNIPSINIADESGCVHIYLLQLKVHKQQLRNVTALTIAALLLIKTY